jgi:hypothetical protein
VSTRAAAQSLAVVAEGGATQLIAHVDQPIAGSC